MIYFSKSANGFFIETINYEMPDDVVEISQVAYNSLMKGQQIGGNFITSNENGYPILKQAEVDYVSQAENQRAQLLASADSFIADWRIELMLGDISDENKAKLSSWMAYKNKIKAVDVSTAPDIKWPAPPE